MIPTPPSLPPTAVDLSVRRSPYSRGEKLRLILWWFARATLYRTSFHTWNGWRCFLLRLFGARMGRNIVLGSTVHITHPWRLEIGDYSQIGDHVWLYSLDRIVIGSNTMVSQRSFLCTGSHDYSLPSVPMVRAPIHVGLGVWVCADCFVGPGVSIGDGAVVGARSCVFRDLPEMTICAGSPCKAVRPRIIREENSAGDRAASDTATG